MSTTVAVGTRDGKVVLEFPEAIQWAALEPEQARLIAEAMAREAYTCSNGRPPDDRKSTIGQVIQQRLVNRVLLVMLNMQRRNKKPALIANELVDICLREVL